MFFRRNSKPPPATDAELVALFREKRDVEALGQLYDRHLETVYAVCWKYLKNRELAQDSAMQIFEVVLKDLPRFEVQNFGAWVHTVARNHCLMQLRGGQKHQEVPLPENSDGELMEIRSPVHHEAEGGEEREMLLQSMETGLQHLPEKQRLCIELFYLKELSYKEVSAQTGLDLKEVKSHIQNGKRNLKIYLEQKSE